MNVVARHIRQDNLVNVQQKTIKVGQRDYKITHPMSVISGSVGESPKTLLKAEI
jgi:hypothetical protein